MVKTGQKRTLSAVADAAGVSMATVSKVINGRSGVGPDTRSRVQQAIGEVGYVSLGQRQASLLRRGEESVELVLDTRDIANPYIATFIQGVMDVAGHFAAGVTLRSHAEVGRISPHEWAQRLARAGCTGVIELTSAYSPDRTNAIRGVGLPTVLVDPIDLPRTSVPSIGATNWQGGYAATHHLLELGHRRIAYIGGPDGAACDVARAHGWAAALSEYGIQADVAGVARGPYSLTHGFDTARALLQQQTPPTAIFAWNDATALGVIQAATSLGLRVPDDLSVVGFDDTPVAAMSSPALTTVHQPIADIGRTALATVVRLAKGEYLGTKRIELATELVIRASTAAPPHATHSRTDTL